MIFTCRFVDGTVDTFQTPKESKWTLGQVVGTNEVMVCNRVIYYEGDKSTQITVSNVYVNFKYIMYAYELGVR